MNWRENTDHTTAIKRLNELGEILTLIRNEPSEKAVCLSVIEEIYLLSLKLLFPKEKIISYDYCNTEEKSSSANFVNMLEDDNEADTDDTFSELLPHTMDALQKVIIEVMEKFDSEKQNLYNYICTRFKLRKIDVYNESIFSGKKYTNKKDKSATNIPTGIAISDDASNTTSNKESKKKIPVISTDQPVNNEESDGISIIDTIADNTQKDFGEMIFIDTSLFELSAQILNFINTHNRNKKMNLSSKSNYFKLFYTSGVTSCIKMCNEPPSFQHERDILNVMKFPFVDFCLTKESRTVKEIHFNSLKTFAEVSEEINNHQQIPLPIPDSVGNSYLSKVENISISKSAYSQQKADYKKEFRSLFP